MDPDPKEPCMKYSSLVGRISGETVSAWDIHYAACAAQARGEDAIVLSIGDPDFTTAEPIRAAAVEALAQGDTHYTEVIGRAALREAIAAKQRRLLAVLVPEPMYLTYAASIQASGARLVSIPQPAEGDFRLTAEALEAVLTPRTRGIALATPNNPTGNVYTADELQAVAEVARHHDLWVISDEVYGQLTYERSHRSIASLEGMAARTVVLNSLSKTHAMTGWRVGWVVGPPALVGHLDNLMLCMIYGLPGFIQAAALKALELDEAVVGDARETYRRRRDLVVRGLADVPLLRCKVPEAGMFMLVDVRETGLSSMDFAWQLFRETGVSVLDAEAFGASCRGFARLSFTVSDAELEEACRRIAGFIQRLQRSR